jgi:hypothetical protein
MKHYQNRLKLTVLVLAFISACLTTRPVLAHERVEIGPYSVIVGWVNEPAIAGERNALFLKVVQGEVAVEGVEATLDAEIQYAGRTYRATLTPTIVPGEYAAEIFPTVRGQYEVRLFGQIEDTAVDQIVEPEEIFTPARLQFPETLPDPFTLQETMSELNSQLQRARIMAVAGVGIGSVGVVLALVSLLRHR